MLHLILVHIQHWNDNLKNTIVFISYLKISINSIRCLSVANSSISSLNKCTSFSLKQSHPNTNIAELSREDLFQGSQMA